MSSLTEEEENFPLAYSILVFKDAYQVKGPTQSLTNCEAGNYY